MHDLHVSHIDHLIARWMWTLSVSCQKQEVTP